MIAGSKTDDSPAAASSFPQPRRALLPDAIADAIAEAIATRHLAPGERIIETALAKRYEVSRVPVREALKILYTQGILTGGGHRGYRVADFTPEKIRQVFEIRLMLESILLRDAIKNWRRDRSSLDVLANAVEAIREAAERHDVREVLRADLNFHLAIAQASDNEIATSMWKAIARHVLIVFNLARYRDIPLDVVVKRHAALLKLVEKHVDSLGTDSELMSALDAHFLAQRAQTIQAASTL
jgi:DNA-binding GntR family transcriptional regulator